MRSLITRKRLVIVLLVLILGAFAYHRYTLYRFEEAYQAYATAAARHDEAATIPMRSDNPLRRDLNEALTLVLTPEASSEERLKRAREGLALLVLAEGNIDAVGDVGADATAAVLAMEDAVDPLSFTAYPKERALIELAHRRLSAIADVRGLSYRANHDTKTIFDQIIADSGELTVEHSTKLERLLPEVEEQFNRRSNLLIEVESLETDIRKTFAEIEAAW